MDKNALQLVEEQLNIPKSKIVTVSQLTNYISGKFEEDDSLSTIHLVGEVSNLSKRENLFFNLKDENSLISAVMFENFVSGLEFELEDGMEILVLGKVQLYGKQGKYQIKVYKAFPIGEGLQALKMKKLKEKLNNEGLFQKEHKKPIPKLPRVIGIITSQKGDAINDMTSSIEKRYSNVHVKLIPTLVQGKRAPQSIIRNLEILNKEKDVDLIVIGRGGGSEEDMACFNEEEVVRAIFNSKKPVVTAIGHENDWFISDLVSDERAMTPTDVASKIIKNKEHLLSEVDYMEDNLRKRYEHIKNIKKQEIITKKQEEVIVQQRKKVLVTQQQFTNQKRISSIYKLISIGIGAIVLMLILTLIGVMS